ncbi:spore protease YyaC [Virgibacillus halodenitrificans]|uniref:spore protease YyaC n=1 Tax=Virgibacillus halodenitrificans TaxID=1482 RepID=UPI00045CE2FC|nr:spore protease YyaC [Virgibacillus halodenitrificans]CDQ31958.1 putative sporulation protein YyaC [Virgibacillus halodenitrificans]
MSLINRFKNKNESFRMFYQEAELKTSLGEKLISWFPTTPRDYIVVFIGTDRSTGDALGPLAGSLLSSLNPKHLTIYGTLHQPVHATNLQDYLDKIKSKHRNPFIIAIDACLGKNTSIGQLIAGTGPISPGAALNKRLPDVGDIHVTGVVNISGFMEYAVLQNTRLSIVMDMATKISELLAYIDQRLCYQHTQPAIVLPINKEITM